MPVKSGMESVTAVLGGHISAAPQGPIDTLEHIQAGKLNLLLILSDKRWVIAPNVPTALEKYGFWAMSYLSIYGPKGLPEYIREKLETAFKKAVDDPSFVKTIKTFREETVYMSGKDYSKLWRSQYDEMGKIIRDMGLAEK